MRRGLLVNSLNKMGLTCFDPQGAFYVFPSIKITGMTSEDFCEGLLRSQKVAVIPGSAFGESGEGLCPHLLFLLGGASGGGSPPDRDLSGRIGCTAQRIRSSARRSGAARSSGLLPAPDWGSFGKAYPMHYHIREEIHGIQRPCHSQPGWKNMIPPWSEKPLTDSLPCWGWRSFFVPG